MEDQNKRDGILRLKRLADELKKAYPKIENRLAKTFDLLDSAIEEIGETWRPAHYAERLLTRRTDAPRRPRSCFAHDTFVNGDEADYVLFVGRGSNGKCGLYVSICKYRIEEPKKGAKSPQVTIKNRLLVSADDLPVTLRVKILDVLDLFAEAYEEHVRQVRKGLLGGLLDDAVDERSSRVEPRSAKTENARKPSAAPSAEDEVEMAEIDAEADADKASEIEKAAVASPDDGIPAKLWIPTKM